MKLTLLQLIALFFVFGWVGGQVIQGPYNYCLALGLFGAFIAAYLNDAHKLLWASIVKVVKRSH